MKNYLKLCLVTNQIDQPLSKYLEFISKPIAGGISMLQIRDKLKNSSIDNAINIFDILAYNSSQEVRNKMLKEFYKSYCLGMAFLE
jgi:thiamine monophosphate synthase